MLILIISVCSSHRASAAIVPDTSLMVEELREIPSERVAYYQGLPEYSYARSIKYETNIFKRAWNSFIARLRQALGISSAAGINDLLFYIIIVLAMAGLIFHLMRSQGSGIWHRKSYNANDTDVLVLEDPSSISDIELKLKEAVDQKNYRMAVRYHFARTIMALDRRELIQWRPALTNYEMLKMVQSHEVRGKLKDLISIFEHTWYGNYEIDNYDVFQHHQNKFNTFINSLSNHV